MDKKAGLLLVGSLGQIEGIESRLCVDDVELFRHLEVSVSLIGLECIQDRQVQEFVERIISTLFTSFITDPEGNEQCVENLTDDMGIDEGEMWTLFERLGYHKNNY